MLIIVDKTELWRGTWRLLIFVNSGCTPVTFVSSVVSGSTHLGCYTDGFLTGMLSTNSYFDRSMKVSNCLAYSESERGSITAGVKYRIQCRLWFVVRVSGNVDLAAYAGWRFARMCEIG